MGGSGKESRIPRPGRGYHRRGLGHEGGLGEGTSLQIVDAKSAGQLDRPEIQSSLAFGIARRS